MGQNRSLAVMQRRSEPHDSLEDFPTPPWATRALVEHVVKPIDPEFDLATVAEPAANRGFMVRPLREYAGVVYASDIFDYGLGYELADFLLPGQTGWERRGLEMDWIITNPPFRLALPFIAKARKKALCGCAMIVRSAFLEGAGRYAELFRDAPPSIIAQFVERVPMIKGRCEREAKSATAYCWLVWLSEALPRPDKTFVWIPPCRKQLERAGDYDLPEVRS